MAVSLLTGGSDKPYVIGLTKELRAKGVQLDLIGSDELNCPELQSRPGLNFLKLRGGQDPKVPFIEKILRIVKYYARLIFYAFFSTPQIFHILWNNKFDTFDRTLLMFYYRLLGKRIVLTAHNVNAAKRDRRDSPLNRFTLRMQYQLAHSIFVHTDKMKQELISDFAVEPSRVTVIPFGINNAVPHTSLATSDARRRLGLQDGQKTILFFGRITPYKGLEYLIAAFRSLSVEDQTYRLIIAGRPNNCEQYWKEVQKSFQDELQSGRIVLHSGYIPDEDVELYFKAANVLVLPYRQIYQSGVLFLSHSFGLPVLAADVGSLGDDIVEGENGSLFQPEDSKDLASALKKYFSSNLCEKLDELRPQIQFRSTERHSWNLVGESTVNIYNNLLKVRPARYWFSRGQRRPRLNMRTPS